jgi:hypothetical protein
MRRITGIVLLLVCLSARMTSGEEPTLSQLTPEQRITVLQKAKQFAKEHNLPLWENQDRPILPLEGKWFRVRLGLVGPPAGPIIHQVLVSTDGRVLDGMQRDAVVSLLRELMPPPRTDTDHQLYLEKYILASSPYDTRVISRLSDIPGYEKHPLEKDFAEVVRPPWKLGDKDAAFYVFYTYTREGGSVKRWKCNFSGGALWSSDIMILGNGIGDAIMYK